MCAGTAILGGCETDSWLDPSRTGYFEFTPTTIPVLNRLDVVEKETTAWGKVSAPSASDLEPGDLQYRLAAGDEVRIEVFELVTQGQTDVAVRTVDPSGNIRLPTLGEVPAAGLTVAQIQKEIESRLRGLINDPIVSVVLERGQGFSFAVSGAVAQPGVFGLTKPDFRLVEALALAGGTFSSIKHVYVIRSQPLDDRMKPTYGDRGIGMPQDSGTPPPTTPDTSGIEDLINTLEQRDGGTTPPRDDAPGGSPSPGALGPVRQDAPQGEPAKQTAPPLDVDELTTPSAPTPSAAPPGAGSGGSGWTWDPKSQTWVPGPGATVPVPPIAGAAPGKPSTEPNLFATRVIEVDYQALVRGDSNLNVIIRPGDQIFADPPPEGVVYIDGEIIRPGVYELPRVGELTLSRLVAAAGGLGQIAIPSRVDLVRKVGPGREAVVRVNLGAIRNRAEPDIMMKADDHVIIGTNFFATPLAVIRNGFRMTYGFGFLLDRNFGNDVFGPPPENFTFN